MCCAVVSSLACMNAYDAISVSLFFCISSAIPRSCASTLDRSGILAHLLRERLLPPTESIWSLKKVHSFSLVVVVRVPVLVSVIALLSVLVPLHVPVLVTVTDCCSRF